MSCCRAQRRRLARASGAASSPPIAARTEAGLRSPRGRPERCRRPCSSWTCCRTPWAPSARTGHVRACIASRQPAMCSSVAVWGGATVDGELRHARNFDFPGATMWDTAPADRVLRAHRRAAVRLRHDARRRCPGHHLLQRGRAHADGAHAIPSRRPLYDARRSSTSGTRSSAPPRPCARRSIRLVGSEPPARGGCSCRRQPSATPSLIEVTGAGVAAVRPDAGSTHLSSTNRYVDPGLRVREVTTSATIRRGLRLAPSTGRGVRGEARGRHRYGAARRAPGRLRCAGPDRPHRRRRPAVRSERRLGRLGRIDRGRAGTAFDLRVDRPSAHGVRTVHRHPLGLGRRDRPGRRRIAGRADARSNAPGGAALARAAVARRAVERRDAGDARSGGAASGSRRARRPVRRSADRARLRDSRSDPGRARRPARHGRGAPGPGAGVRGHAGAALAGAPHPIPRRRCGRTTRRRTRRPRRAGGDDRRRPQPRCVPRRLPR
jgi:hypothetical protein